ncbi:3-isopropylmalate dehydratase large subunit [Orrella sp. NBD-18]|uniref:3-isopropylmalate dehydratase n=1 Tax=Sheuella amnicola TaxID=2707330 RepID=A0A6B2QTY3_9BURK|nr:3-isopropylmalate dehydratase large subunit [Sheuella amnicola]HBI83555.1 3-isopropylmalate dehydratase large subunit [Alcaligenaceae bacterium]
MEDFYNNSSDSESKVSQTTPRPQTLFEKIWARHVVLNREQGPSLIYIDRHIVHDGSVHAFRQLRSKGLTVRKPLQVFGVADHYIPTKSRFARDAGSPEAAEMFQSFDRNMEWAGVRHFSMSDPGQGIVHVVGPEQGISLPGMTIVCTDSHTSTHGALGAIAFGIGQSESAHVMATQTLWQAMPKTFRINVIGDRSIGFSAKDIVLAIIRKIGADGAVGHAIEFAGQVVDDMSVEERLTLCNMAIEAGGRCGIIAPDDKVFEYLKNKPFGPTGSQWDEAVGEWRTLKTDPLAVFDRELDIDISGMMPVVTWGTSPDMSAPIDGCVPDPAIMADPQKRASAIAALDYMGLSAGQPMNSIKINRVFIGSCTNARLSDLREAAKVLKGRRAEVPGIVVPGSTLVKMLAEAEGLDQVFMSAGLEWRESGCSMCVAINGDVAHPGERVASTSNRNFVGRQGPSVRTHLVSPAVAAASALTGYLTNPVEVTLS